MNSHLSTIFSECFQPLKLADGSEKYMLTASGGVRANLKVSYLIYRTHARCPDMIRTLTLNTESQNTITILGTPTGQCDVLAVHPAMDLCNREQLGLWSSGKHV